MRLGWALACMVGTSLALGGLASAAMQGGLEPAPPLSFTVPVGNIGDEYVYKRIQTYDDVKREEDRLQFRMRGVEEVPDNQGNHRRTVRFEQAGIRSDHNGGNAVRTEYVDLLTRELPYIVDDGVWDDGTEYYAGHPGPDMHGWPVALPTFSRPEGSYKDPNAFWLRFQGMRLSHGADLTEWRGPELALERDRFGTPRDFESYSSVVDGQGTFQGKPVLGVTERWHVVERAVAYESRGEMYYWFSADHPVPVHVVRDVHYSELDVGPVSYHVRFEWTLAGMTRGQEPIPWMSEADGPNLRIPAVERADSPRWQPEEGSGHRLPMTVARARQNVETDPTLSAFGAWRAANPGWQLVGADTYSGTPLIGIADAPGHVWTLTYAAPGGSTAYRVQSSYVHAQSPPVHMATYLLSLDRGAVDMRLPSAAPAGDRPTLTQIDRWWQAFADPAAPAKTPDRFSWGYAFLGECQVASGEFDLCASEATTPSYVLHRVWWGSAEGVQAGLPANPVGEAWDLLSLNATAGRLTYYESSARRGQLRFGEVAIQDDPPPEELLGNVPGVDHGQAALAFTSVAAGSFLVFLTVYLWPAIKFGLARIVVGFTRLEASDVERNRHRRAILDAVAADPGVDATEIARRVPEASWSTVVYHIAVLYRHGLLAAQRDGRHRRFYPANTPPARQVAAAVLHQATTRRAYELLQGEDLLRRELARRLGVTAQTVSWHLERLTQAGLVDRIPHGRAHLYRARTRAGPT